MIQLDYQITLPEYIEGNQAVYKAKLSRPWLLWGLFRALPVLMLLSGVLMLWTGIFALTHTSGIESSNPLLVWMEVDRLSEDDATTYVVLGCISLAVSIMYPVFLRPNFIVKMGRTNYEQTWQKNPLMGECRTLTATEAGLDLKSESLQITWEWATLTRVVESQMVFILYWFTGEGKMISKQCLSSEDALNQFRELVRQNVKNYVNLTQDSV
jgi:YcxB-like protein